MQRPTWLRPVLFPARRGFPTLALLSHTAVGLAGRAACAHPGGRAPSTFAWRSSLSRSRWSASSAWDGRSPAATRSGARAGRATRRAVQRERRPHARPRRHRGAPRPRSEEPARGHQGPLDPHGAQRDRPEDRRAAGHRRRRGRSPPVDRRRVPLVLAGARRPEVAPTQPYEIARELGSCSRRAPKRRASTIETGGDERSSSTPTRASCGRRSSTSCSTRSRPRRAARACTSTSRATARDRDHGARRRGRDDARRSSIASASRTSRRRRAAPASGWPSRAAWWSSTAGSLEFKSTPRAGTTVTILLPMKAKPCARLPNPGAFPARRSRGRGRARAGRRGCP